MKLLKLQFGGLLSNNDEEGTFTCILEEKNDDKRKLFLQLTKAEAEEILLYLRQNKDIILKMLELLQMKIGM